MKQYFKTDKNKFAIIESCKAFKVGQQEEGYYKGWTGGLYKPKWDTETETWVEGLTDKELAEIESEAERIAREQEALEQLKPDNLVQKLGLELTALKLEDMQKDSLLKMLGQQIVELKLQQMQGGE